MKIREYNRDEAKNKFIYYKENGISQECFDALDSDYQKIRNDILTITPNPISKSYEFDLLFGIKLYEYFTNNTMFEFNEALASNYDFWRYICLAVVPDIIEARHGLIESYFYDKNVRMYIPTLWWYINMAYQGDLEDTYEALKGFSTDFILQLVERPGRDGMYLEVTRLLFKYISKLDIKIINEKKNGQTLLRRLLIQHTAKVNNYNLIIEGKEEEYVKSLFSSCGVEV